MPPSPEIVAKAGPAELERLRDEVLRALATLGGAVAALAQRVERLERERR